MTIAQDVAATPTEIASSLLARVQRAKLLDPMDYPGQWTKRQCQIYDTVRARGAAYRLDLAQVVAMLETATARLADCRPKRERQGVVEATLVKQLGADPKSDELKLSLLTLRRGGVSEDNGRFTGIPAPLGALLRKTCDHCGHTTVEWEGSIARLDQENADASKAIADANVRLNNYLMPDVEAWLKLVAVPEEVAV